MVWQALKRGMQSVSDDIARSNFASRLKDSVELDYINSLGNATAKEVADVYPNLQKEVNEFAQEFLSNSRPLPEDNMLNAAAHFTGRKLTQGGKFFTDNPMGQNIMFSAPFILPAIMPQQQPQQMSEEEYKQMLQAQMQQGRSY